MVSRDVGSEAVPWCSAERQAASGPVDAEEEEEDDDDDEDDDDEGDAEEVPPYPLYTIF